MTRLRQADQDSRSSLISTYLSAWHLHFIFRAPKWNPTTKANFRNQSIRLVVVASLLDYIDISRIVPGVWVSTPILIVHGFTGTKANSLKQSGCFKSSDFQRLTVLKFKWHRPFFQPGHSARGFFLANALNSSVFHSGSVHCFSLFPFLYDSAHHNLPLTTSTNWHIDRLLLWAPASHSARRWLSTSISSPFFTIVYKYGIPCGGPYHNPCSSLLIIFPVQRTSSLSLLLTHSFGLIPCEYSSRQALLSQNSSLSFLDNSIYHLSVDNCTHFLWALGRGIPKLTTINLFSSVPLIIVLQSCIVQVVGFPLLSFPVFFRSTQTHLPRRWHLCCYRFYIKPTLFAFLFYFSETIIHIFRNPQQRFTPIVAIESCIYKLVRFRPNSRSLQTAAVACWVNGRKSMPRSHPLLQLSCYIFTYQPLYQPQHPPQLYECES